MTELDFIKHVAGGLERSYSALGKSHWIKPPQWRPTEEQFRHETQHDCLLIYLKGVRWASLLNASIILLEAGHVHEIGILCRCMDESFEDMLLFIRNLGQEGEPTKEQERVLKEFSRSNLTTHQCQCYRPESVIEYLGPSCAQL